MLKRRFPLSERRACRLTGQHRSTQRREPRRGQADALRAWLRTFSRTRPRWGYRRAYVGLRAEGWAVNQALATLPRRRIDADATVATLDRVVETRGCAPEFIRCDNGPRYDQKLWIGRPRESVAYLPS